MNPRTAAEIRRMHTRMRLMTSPLARKVTGLFGRDEARSPIAADALKVPMYPTPLRS